MNVPLFLTIFGVLGFICLWVGRRAGKGNQTNEDYFLADRKLKIFPLAMTLLATQLGGGAMMGACDEAYAKGWAVLFYPLGMVIGLILLGLGVGARMRKLELKTIAELFERKFGSVSLRRIASILSILSLFFILAAQGIASRKFFAALGFAPNILFTLFWLTVVVYTTFGGFKGVVWTDMVQALFILGALSICVFSFFLAPTVASSLPITPPENVGSLPWFSWLAAPLLFMLIEQDMGQRCFSAKDGKTISIAAVSAGVLLFIASFAPILFGCTARSLGLVFPEGTSILLGSVEALTNSTASTFMALAILMAIVSTVDSLLNSISSNLVFDFSLSKKKNLGLAQGLTAFLGISTFLLSFIFDNVLSLLIFSYKLSISVLFVPIAFALFSKRNNKRACLFSMIGGALGFIFLRDFPYFELIVISASTLSFLIGDLSALNAMRKREGEIES